MLPPVCAIRLRGIIPKERWAVKVVNPDRVVPDGDCSGFMDDSPLKNAYGMEHLLDNVPYRQAKEIRREMREYFGTTHFYRLTRQGALFYSRRPAVCT